MTHLATRFPSRTRSTHIGDSKVFAKTVEAVPSTERREQFWPMGVGRSKAVRHWVLALECPDALVIARP